MSKKNRTTKITSLIAAEIQASAPKPPAPPAPPKPRLVNHVLLLLDDSGSMHNCYNEAVKQVNAIVANAKQKAKDTEQITTLSTYMFGGGGRVSRLYTCKPIEHVEPLSTYFADGPSTPLLDAIGTAIEDGKRFGDANDINTSFLIVCATDGGENSSRSYWAARIQQLIADVQQTDRWTLAFMVPNENQKATLARYGVPAANITTWNNTIEGAREVFAKTNVAVDSYYATRSAGQKSTKSFYTTDLSNLKKSDLSKMTDLSGHFKKWQVNAETDIKSFVQSHGVAFFLGAGYYPVTKKELLRVGRNVLVREKGTNRIFGGADARSILGIPAGEVLVTPGNHANFDIFFQSTSVNRKLVRGTELLWDKSQLVDSALGETWDSAAAKAAADAKKAQQPTT